MLMRKAISLLILLLAVCPVMADERRAPAPRLTDSETKGIFFDSLDQAIRGQRPTLASLRNAAKAAGQMAVASAASGAGPDTGGSDLWSSLISPTSLEDEIKRVRLHYDSIITTPGAFNSGGYQEARLDLTVMAVMFALISEHSGDVRWKEQAPAARDLLARTAFNCKAGSTQVYNEAKLRKADLQDLVSGTGLANRDGDAANEWTSIADRSPLMEYAGLLIEKLEDSGNSVAAIQENVDSIKRNAELLSALGEVLVQEGMDDADDDDYAGLSRGMTKASKEVVAAIDRGDFEAAGSGISGIRQQCDACHEIYR